MAPRNPQATSWCFTLNNYGEREEADVVSFFGEFCRYAIYGREVGESGTRHLQGYFILKVRAGFKVTKERIGHAVHLEAARGSPVQNRDYCSKGGDFVEHGRCPAANFKDAVSPSKQSRRELVSRSFASSMDKGRSGMVSFIDEFPEYWFFSGHHLLGNYLRSRPPITRDDIKVWWYWGAPGVGKSRRAHMEYPEAYIKEPRSKWWNGYQLEDAVIIDDYAAGGIDLNHLLRWFDRYKCLVESKGGMLPLYATKFVVTSNFHPDVVFRKEVVGWGNTCNPTYEPHPQLDALMRRINVLELF